MDELLHECYSQGQNIAFVSILCKVLSTESQKILSLKIFMLFGVFLPWHNLTTPGSQFLDTEETPAPSV